ncbi:MAG: phage portal protein family protein [Treponemataceae bacterium]
MHTQYATSNYGKGFSVNELMWDSSGNRWKPLKYYYRHPQWFEYDFEDGRTLKLRNPIGSELIELKPHKFIIHEPHLISGSQITSGFACIYIRNKFHR